MINKKIFSSSWIYLFILISLCLFYILNDYSTIRINDDLAVQNMLLEGIYGTLILSYPTSFILSKAYAFFPSIPWYSLLLLLSIFFNIYLISVYISKTKILSNQLLLLLFFSFLVSYILIHVSITIVTVFTMLSAAIFIRNNVLYFSLMILFSFLLRTSIAIPMLPFTIISWLLLGNSIRTDKLTYYKTALVVAMIIFTLLIPKLDSTYAKWLQFNSSRAAIYDRGGLATNTSLTKSQIVLLKHWWVQDESILPEKALKESSPKLYTILLQKIRNFQIINPLTHRYFFLFIMLIIATIILVFYNLSISKIKSFLLLLLLFGIVFLLSVRDVDRVTILLLVLWSLVIFHNIQHTKIKTFFLLSIVILYGYYLSPKLEKENLNMIRSLQSEALQLIEKNKIQTEVSIAFPLVWHYSVKLFQGNILLQEKTWMKRTSKSILPGGWTARSEYFNRTHNIPTKYPTYYDFLIAPETGFIGDKEVNTELGKIILPLYDQKFLKNKPYCKHIVKIVDTSEHFSIAQINISCTNKE